MKFKTSRIRPIPLILAIAIAASIFTYSSVPDLNTCTYESPAEIPESPEGIVSFLGGTQTLYVEVAKIQDEHRTGLMNRESMPQNQGMLFIFSSDSPRSFWMKNTLIHLDMIFINSDLEIVKIHGNVPPCTADPCPTYSSGAPSRYVVETVAGYTTLYGITEGQIISFTLLA